MREVGTLFMLAAFVFDSASSFVHSSGAPILPFNTQQSHPRLLERGHNAFVFSSPLSSRGSLSVPSLGPIGPSSVRRKLVLGNLGMRTTQGGNAISFMGTFLRTRAKPLLGCLLVLSLLSWLFWKAANILMNMLGYALTQCLTALCTRFPLPFCFWVIPTWIAPAAAALLVGSFILPLLGYIPSLIDEAATPVYEVEKEKVGGNARVQLRSYLEFQVAETPVYGESVAKKMAAGFAKLVKFVTGENRDPATGKSVNVGMSGLLVLRDFRDGQGTRAAFSLPEGKIPAPTDQDISITTIQPQRYVVVTYTGPLPSDRVLGEYEAEARQAMAAEALEPAGEPIIAQVMSQLQTEVMIPVGPPLPLASSGPDQ